MDARKVAVIGAGIMGSGIALACSKGGFEVKIWDSDALATRKALSTIRSTLDRLVSSDLLSVKDSTLSFERIASAHQMSQAVENAKVIFEAVPENIDLKKQVFKKLNAMCGNEAILASNTSSFKIAHIATGTKTPHRVIGTHWNNPPYLMPLVEVVRGPKTSDQTVKFIRDFLVTIGKRPVLCKDTAGFLVNRLHSALLVEAISMVENGIASMEDIDLAMTHHLGPRYCVVGSFQLMDSFGLDTELAQYSYLRKMTNSDKFKPPRLLRNKVRNHELGLKTGKGFYDYSGKNIQAIIHDRDERLIKILRFLRI